MNTNNKERKKNVSGTLCWRCKKSMPCVNETLSEPCPYSLKFKPVEGWIADKHSRFYKVYGIYDTREKKFINSKSTGDVLTFASRKQATDRIREIGLDQHVYIAKVARSIERTSYFVKQCPLFEEG